MFEIISKNLVNLKQEFRRIYSGTSHIQEIIPLSESDILPIPQKDLNFLHLFLQNNSIYYNNFEEKINDVNCMVYEGDINKYWLNSIGHESSTQPFSPTWMLTAYIITSIAKILNYKEVLDIGSGDGRIAYCGKFLGLNTYGIEIDNMLIDLQNDICKKTMINFNPICSDAVKFDYDSLKLIQPAFFIGGLPQMGGDKLANNIISNLDANLKENTCMVLTGSYSEKYSVNDTKDGGWRKLIDDNGLNVIQTNSLPTVWSFNQTTETPYIFTKFL
ncbi:MAG: hypothetical protein O3C04_02080 [Crenarchaeota archaeon]|nr:hypothetical protein [Thermoproteota archaeon]MDA1124419.1 hypothetical protein [Thermoproteota archaeon]